jgi:capsid portal protein
MISRRRSADRLSLRRRHGGSFAAGKRQRYVRLIEDGQRLGDGFFEVLQDRFQGNFGGIREQLVKVVFNVCDAFCSARRL